jgi:hypothetical protein
MPMPTIRLSNVVMVGESYQSDRVGTMTRKTQLRRIERGRPAARPQLPPPANAMPLEQHRTGYPPAPSARPLLAIGGLGIALHRQLFVPLI